MFSVVSDPTCVGIMSLSCYCDDYDGSGWYYYGPEDYMTLNTKRSRKCCSCKSKIKPGDLCTKFVREKYNDDMSVEYRIYGDTMELAPYWMCEECSDLYFNLDELGFCITIGNGESMRSLTREYAAMRRAE
jgi:hypothetical protein